MLVFIFTGGVEKILSGCKKIRKYENNNSWSWRNWESPCKNA